MIWRTAGVGLILAGLALLGLTATGTGSVPEPHSKRAAVTTHKSGLPVLSAADAKRELAATTTPITSQESLETINKVIASAIVRYWPKAEEQDREVLRTFRENWLLALAQRIGIGNAELTHVERREYGSALAKGVGLCSQAALTLADFLNRHGIEAKIAGLDGHVVAMAEVQGKSFILDPDYGVVLPMSIAEAQSRSDDVRDAYVARGYPAPVAEKVAKIYGAEGNKVVAPEAYMATAAWRIRLFEIGCWVVPILLMLLGIVMLRRPYNHSSVSTRVPSATR